jgi:hypothetical protein
MKLAAKRLVKERKELVNGSPVWWKARKVGAARQLLIHT